MHSHRMSTNNTSRYKSVSLAASRHPLVSQMLATFMEGILGRCIKSHRTNGRGHLTMADVLGSANLKEDVLLMVRLLLLESS